MAVKFIKYRSFNDKALATELCQLLAENNIPFAWESTEGFFDVSFANNDILNLYYVKLRQEDFAKADELLMNSVMKSDQQPIGDYYLFSFSTEELIEVLQNPDEWNAFDQYWAKKILKSRGVEISDEELSKAKAKKLDELKRPWIVDKLWLFLAFTLWVVALWFVLFYAAIAVILLSVYISFSKKTMPDGQKVLAFSETDRLLGEIVLVAGILLFGFILFQYFGVIEFMHPL
jgi:hypothetical protein